MSGRQRKTRAQRELQRKDSAERQGGLRAVGYVRVSTEEQAENGSGLDYQRQAVRDFAKAHGYTVQEIVEDPGVSGSKAPADRAGFGRILRELAPGPDENGKPRPASFDVLLVWKFDRLARSIHGAVSAAQTLKERGVGLRSCTEAIDTTGPQGELVFALLTGMAGMEREAIARRTWEGRKAKAARGGHAGGQIPYGYKKGPDGALVVDETEANVVRRIFKMERAGKGVRAIATALNADGVPTRRGGPWSPWTVRDMLDNPRYGGRVDYLFGAQGLATGWTQGGQRIIVPSEAPAILGKASGQ